MSNVFLKTLKIYFNTFHLMAMFSIFVLLSLLLLPWVSSFVAGGTGFIRFTSILYDLTLVQILMFIAVVLISILLLSIFMSAVICIVKLKETLDSIGFSKLVRTFPHFTLRIFIFLLFLAVVALFIGTLLALVSVPYQIIQLILVILWLMFAFTPHVTVLEDLPLVKAMSDNFTFIKNNPLALVYYILFGFISILLVALLEVLLGQVLVWEHKIISVVIISIFVLPVLQVLAIQCYVRRYGVARM